MSSSSQPPRVFQYFNNRVTVLPPLSQYFAEYFAAIILQYSLNIFIITTSGPEMPVKLSYWSLKKYK
jgi:hypothetical protein